MGLASFHAETVVGGDNVDSLNSVGHVETGLYPESLDAFNRDHTILSIATSVKLTRVNKSFERNVSTLGLTMLRASIVTEAVSSRSSFKHEKIVEYFGEPVLGVSSVAYIAEARLESTRRVTVLESKIVAWEGAVVSERLRIKAEEQRKAIEAEAARVAAAKAEAARVAAAKSANSKTPTGSPSKTSTAPAAPSAAGESDLGRLQRIASTLPFAVPTIVIGSCDSTGLAAAVACYSVGGDVITVIPSYLSRPDCKLRRVIAHESRHYWQYTTGKLTFDSSGQVSNAPWAESDAYAFGDSYGCK